MPPNLNPSTSTHRVDRGHRQLREGRLPGAPANGQRHVLGHALRPGLEGDGGGVEVVVEALALLFFWWGEGVYEGVG